MSGASFTSNIGAVILAAGASSRMHETKQLLPWKQTTLINHCIEQSAGSNAQEVFVVLGAHAENILQNLNPKAQVQVNFTSNTTSMRKDEKSVLSKVKVAIPQASAEPLFTSAGTIEVFPVASN
mgnify:CR=1 FL=1